MSPVQQKPILHGRDHCPGGADPIPCMIQAPSGDFEGVLLATGPFAYWRLGETGEPWADTSGAGIPADLVEELSGTALTPDVTGALPAGLDDGALEFNYDGTSGSGGRYVWNNGSDKDFGFPGGEMTACAWVNVKASALSRRGQIIGNISRISLSTTLYGWGLEVIYPGRSIRFTRGEGGSGERYVDSSGGLDADTWYFVAGSYDGTTLKVYVNGSLEDTTADASSGAMSSDPHIWFGYGGEPAPSAISWLYGSVDEAAVWDRVLSTAEIYAIYSAGVEGSGGGEVLLTDGAGGTYWDFPLEVTF